MITAGQLFVEYIALFNVPIRVLKSGSITLIPRVASAKAGHNKKIRFCTVKQGCIAISIYVSGLQC